MALELVSRELDLNTLSSNQAEKAWQLAQRKPPAACNQTPARDPPLPDATKSLQSRGPRDQAPAARVNAPKVNQTEGLGNPHSVRRQTAQPTSGPEPATVRRDQIAPVRGDRDRTPTNMAVITVEVRHSKRSPDHHNPYNNRHHNARADGVTAAQDEWPLVFTLVLGTRLSPLLEGLGPPPGSAPPGIRRESPSPHQFRTDHEQAGDSD